MRGSTQPGLGAAKGIQAPGGHEPLVAALRLEVGSRVSATVLELLGEGKVLVGLRGLQVEARTEVPLEPGSRHLFTVMEAGETIRLGLGASAAGTRETNPAEGLLARLLGRAASLSLPEILVRLLEEARSAQGVRGALGSLLELWSRRPENASDLERLVRRLGLDHEALLKRAAQDAKEPMPPSEPSLKALLLEEASRRGPLQARLEAALAALEGLQAENLHLARTGGGLLVPLPHVAGLASGEIRFFAPGEGQEGAAGREGKSPFRVLILLDLERLGPIRVALESLGPDLRILFECVCSETRSAVRACLPALRASLEGLGLRPSTLEILPERSSEPDKGRLAPVERMQPGSLVDVEG